MNTRNSDYYKYENAVIGDARGTVSEDGSISGRNGALAKTLYTYKNWTLQEQLRWNMTCNDRHNIEVLLGHENYSYRYDYTYTSKTNEAFPNRYALSNFSEMASISGYKPATALNPIWRAYSMDMTTGTISKPHSAVTVPAVSQRNHGGETSVRWVPTGSSATRSL